MDAANQRKTKAHNELKSWLNENTPKILEILNQGFKLKTDGNLFKKDKDAINKILDDHPDRMRASFNNKGSGSTIRLVLWADIRYEASKHGWNYISEELQLVTMWIGDNETRLASYIPYELNTPKQLEDALKRTQKIADEIRELERERSKLKTKYKIG